MLGSLAGFMFFSCWTQNRYKYQGQQRWLQERKPAYWENRTWKHLCLIFWILKKALFYRPFRILRFCHNDTNLQKLEGWHFIGWYRKKILKQKVGRSVVRSMESKLGHRICVLIRLLDTYEVNFSVSLPSSSPFK